MRIKSGIMDKRASLWVALLLLACVLAFTACSRGKGPVHKLPAGVLASDSALVPDTLNGQSEVEIMMERMAVLERAKSIYSLVRAYYRSQGGVVDNDLLDKSFCSISWNKLLLMVRGKEGMTNTLFYEINPWSMTIDGGKIVTFDDFEVTRLVMGEKKKATVAFVVYEADTYTPARVDMVYENGRWVIDNFYNLKYGLDVRNCMWEYLAKDML